MDEVLSFEGFTMRLAVIVTAMLFALPTLAIAQPAPVPTPTATPASDQSQEIVCRKDKETGSLVRAKKTCHTRAQWAYIAETNQNFSRELVDSTRGRPGSN